MDDLVNLPKGRKLLVLDLDETLLFATEEPLSTPAAFNIDPSYVYVRPHLQKFLESCAVRLDLAVWTASSIGYATAVVTQVFGSVEHLAFLWARDRCTNRYDPETRETYWVKDLKKIRRIGYELARVIVVDDTAKKHERNYENLVRVRPFEGQLDDDELLHLAGYLETLAGVDDVRVVEKRGWRRTVWLARALTAPGTIESGNQAIRQAGVSRMGRFPRVARNAGSEDPSPTAEKGRAAFTEGGPHEQSKTA